jgi:DNA-binding LacI/PurR family transcriptional regulator
MNVMTATGGKRGGGDGLCLYERVCHTIKRHIKEGKFVEGRAIPSHKELSRLCDVSEITVRRAIQELVREGVLGCRSGSGTFVLGNKFDSERAEELSKDNKQLTTPLNLEHIGVVCANIYEGYPFLQKVIRGVKQYFDEIGQGRLLHFFEFQLSENIRSKPDFSAMDSSRGLLLNSPVDLGLIVWCREQGIPYVLMHNDLIDGYSHCVFVDYTSGVLQAVSHLVDRNRRRIAMVNSLEHRFSAGLIDAGFNMSLNHFHLEHVPELIIHAGYGEEPGYEATKKLLSLPTPPDAILYASDLQAKGGLLAAQEVGCSIPNDMSIIGMGNVLRPKESPIDITTVDLNLEQMGKCGARILDMLVRHEQNVPCREVIVPKLVVRDST